MAATRSKTARRKMDGMGATFGTRLLTWLRGQRVGTDLYGNSYYRLRGDKPTGRGGGRFSRERRWVIYAGEPEGSKVPPEWHAWLHHVVNDVPQGRQRYAWEKDHQPNLTGTPLAYHPQGSVLRGGHRAASTGDYEPWSPE
ncbi:MAG TPA: NADH:ubiquinone oxidoreductase subunit NDUFA12 [Stellaceae bacterium]|nr:NADH:ubiquinone oxidoreductase subunit NDUFA12 [Stellaceae bacterium]